MPSKQHSALVASLMHRFESHEETQNMRSHDFNARAAEAKASICIHESFQAPRINFCLTRDTKGARIVC